MLRAGEVIQHHTSFVRRKHDRQPLRPPRAYQIAHPRKRLMQNAAIQKKKRAQGLVLRRRAHAVVDGESRQERVDLIRSHRRVRSSARTRSRSIAQEFLRPVENQRTKIVSRISAVASEPMTIPKIAPAIPLFSGCALRSRMPTIPATIANGPGSRITEQRPR